MKLIKDGVYPLHKHAPTSRSVFIRKNPATASPFVVSIHAAAAARKYGGKLLLALLHAGQVQGTAWQHTPQSMAAALATAWVALPAKATGATAFNGKLADAPKTPPPGAVKVPVVVFAHGSSGINDAIKSWQKWLADDVGIASITLDGISCLIGISHTAPVGKDVYEKVHVLRAREIAGMVAAVATLA